MFSVPTRTQYGIRALVHLARSGSGSVASAEIARVEGISPKYLEGILAQLKAQGLVLAERGKHGGYRLARDPAELTMLEVVASLEGEVKPVECVEDGSCCAQGGGCMPRKFWIGLKESIDGYLASRTLKDVLEA